MAMRRRSNASTPRLTPTGQAGPQVNAVAEQVNLLADNMATENSPVLVYGPDGDPLVSSDGDSITEYVWIAPDEVTEVQVECYGGAGGGGGGGPTAQGAGGGAGAGEYACEPNYPVVPGEAYSYFAGHAVWGGLPDLAGANGFPGVTGLDTVFDPRGKGITGGVIAHGGQGGDQGGVGVPGKGGSGSLNTIHFDGGSGGGIGGNVFSDNPWNLLSDSTDNLALWLRLDESKGTVAYDYSDNSRNTNQVFKTSGAFVQPTNSGGAPVQTPVIGDRNGNPVGNGGESLSSAWKFDRATSGHGGGYVAVPTFGFGGPGSTVMTVSAWVKGLPTAANAGDWGSNTAAGQHSTIIGNADTDLITKGGFHLSINSNSKPTFVVRTDSGTFAVTAASAMSAIDGNWHMLTATFLAGDASGLNLYVDGALAGTTSTAGSSYFQGGPQPIAVGMDRDSSGYYFNGYASNAYVAREVYSSVTVGLAFGSSVSVGGGGGGASGGSAGAGNAGGNGSGATGGSGGAGAAASTPGVNNGSAAGAAGGTGANTGGGNSGHAAPFGGAGGGSASHSTTISGISTLEIDCLRSASYCGYDAQGGFNGSMYTVSEDPSHDSVDPYYNTAARQDGTVYSGGQSDSPFNGSMNSILVLPDFRSVVAGKNGAVPTYLGDPTQWDILGVFLNLTIETENACTIPWSEWRPNNLPSSISDAVLTAAATQPVMGVLRIPAGPAGRRVQVPLANSGAFPFHLQGSAPGLLLGGLQGSASFERLGNSDGNYDNPEAPDWYCSFHGAENGDTGLAASLTVKYAGHGTYSGINPGGKGDPGYIVISFIDPRGLPVASVLPFARTDENGNALGPGFTADTTAWNVWHPGSSPKVLETWQFPSMLTGWANNGLSLRYKLLPGNMVWINGVISNLSGGTDGVLFTLPVGYRPVSTQGVYFRQQGLTPAPNASPSAFVQNDGTVNIKGTTNTATYQINSLITLDS